MFNKLIIDSTNSITDLCKLGEKFPTDKSPLNKDPNLHKHAYTAIYDMLFSSLPNRGICIGEIGILDNNSIKCWDNYFKNTLIYGFEYNQSKIDEAFKQDFQNYQNQNDIYYINIDVRDKKSINVAFSKAYKFSILIDDSTHQFEDQIRVMREGYKYMQTGGFLIIEDIFKSEDENRYYKALKDLIPYFSCIYFVEANHKNIYSPGWDNDKLLILVRNDKPCGE